MKNGLLLVVAVSLVVIYSCNSDSTFKKDVEGISQSMCRNIDVMNRLKAANPADSVTVKKLQADAHQVQVEMTVLYKEFESKYKEKMKDDKFNKNFAKELRKSMLNCPSLSKKDREEFERELAD